MPSNNPEASIRMALSPARIGTYELASASMPRINRALALYAWNAQVAGAMLAPMHICEVVIRNAVSDALAAQYGTQWPWSHGFEQSLPNPVRSYSLLKDLKEARHGAHSVGKVVPELTFMFWQSLFTQRFDQRIWDPYLRTVFPYTDPKKSVKSIRPRIYNDLEQLRRLRNRIAHHEPIFNRNLSDDLKKVHDLVALRCPITAQWMMDEQLATHLIAARP